jgi:hypothetical protein
MESFLKDSWLKLIDYLRKPDQPFYWYNLLSSEDADIYNYVFDVIFAIIASISMFIGSFLFQTLFWYTNKKALLEIGPTWRKIMKWLNLD